MRTLFLIILFLVFHPLFWIWAAITFWNHCVKEEEERLARLKAQYEWEDAQYEELQRQADMKHWMRGTT
jgi:hypothetical protein